MHVQSGPLIISDPAERMIAESNPDRAEPHDHSTSAESLINQRSMLTHTSIGVVFKVVLHALSVCVSLRGAFVSCDTLWGLDGVLSVLRERPVCVCVRTI